MQMQKDTGLPFENKKQLFEKWLKETLSKTNGPQTDPSSLVFLRFLGKGFFGEVNKLLHKETGMVVAQKVFSNVLQRDRCDM